MIEDLPALETLSEEELAHLRCRQVPPELRRTGNQESHGQQPHGKLERRVHVAAGDLNRDGHTDIIAGPGQGMKPQVRVWSGSGYSPLQSYLAFAPDYRGGVTVAVGDIDGNGQADVVAGKATGAAWVRVFDGGSSSQVAGPLGSFLAFERRGGVSLATGDVDGDGAVDILAASGANTTPAVRIFSRARAGFRELTPFDATLQQQVRLGAADVDGDGIADILAACGPGAVPEIRAFRGTTLELIEAFLAEDATFRDGLFLAGGR